MTTATNDRWQDVLSGSARWAVVQGDCLDVLREMPDSCVDAVVTDPPAGIGFMGKEWDDFRRARNPADSGRDSPFGRASRSGPEYARRPRQAFVETMTAIFAEVLRALKPGGHAVIWAIPRTSHWTAWAIEDAGFEIRDCLTHLFGSGFPKSLSLDDVAPGWGTALKPASEHWWLCRKPFKGTVAANVLEHGTGGINVEACRVAGVLRRPGNLRDSDCALASRAMSGKKRTTAHAYSLRIDAGAISGRWPTNLLLTHSQGCEQIGESEIIGSGAHVRHATGAVQSVAKGRERPHETAGYGDGHLKTVPAYRCVPGCPVAELDRQSGELTSGANPTRRGSDKFRGVYQDFAGQTECEAARGQDIGTASRFYPTFEISEDDLVPFRYVAKPSTAEREKGCEGLVVPESTPHNLSSNACARCGKRVKANGSGDKCECGDERETVQTSDRRNHHPTVKSIALMTWFVRLVTPPGGVVLDPFAGSGTTGIAAYRDGFRFVGIEREPDFCAIARARIEPKGVLL